LTYKTYTRMFDIVKKLRTLLTPEAVPGTQVDALCQAMQTQAADLKAIGNALNGMVVSYEYLPGDARYTPGATMLPPDPREKI